MTQGDLFNEVQRVVDEGLAEEKIVSASWITTLVMSHHDDVNGADADWYRLCAYEHVRDTVRQVLHRYKVTPEAPDPQIILPGMERLQHAYLIEREKEQVVAPLEQMTDLEIESKANEIEQMAFGCLQHAKELRRYRGQRTPRTA